MRTAIKKTKVYAIDELSESAKESALNKMRENWLDYDWYMPVYDDAKTVAALMGIDIDLIYFSGFSSQGDGACFTGAYSYKAGSIKAIKSYAPNDTALHQIVKNLTDIQKRNFYQLTASIDRRGHYYHSGCMAINVDRNSSSYQGVKESDESDLIDTLREFADWIYSRLESTYEYLLSDDAMIEICLANKYEFTESGNFYY